MTRLILHIGTHKTGTTALQSAFANSADVLAAHDISYPIAKLRRPNVLRERNAFFLDRKAKISLEPSSKDERDDAFYNNGKATLKAACRKHGTVLLSDERLWYEGAYREGYWEKVRELLEPYEFSNIQIVLYLRRQDTFVSSLWNQYVKGTRREARTLEKYANTKKIRAILDYDAGVTHLEQVFGKENLLIRIFDRKQFPGGDVVRDFCECVGFDFVDELSRPQVKENLSLTNRVAYIKNLINRGNFAKETDNIFYLPSQTASKLEEGKDKRSFLSYEQTMALLDRYKEGNARIAQRYFGREDGELFAAPSPDIEKFEGDLSQTEIDALMMLSEALCCERMQRLELQARVNELERQLNVTNKNLMSSFTNRARRFKRNLKRGRKKGK